MKNCSTVNVRDFGALGDGIHDDAPSIQKALDSLKESGGIVFMPAGFYRMCAGVIVPMGVAVSGVTTATTGPWQNYLDTQDKGIELEFGISLRGIGEQWIDPRLYKGTWVLSDHGYGEANGAPTFRMMGNTSVSKIGFVNRYLPPVTDEFVACPPNIAHISTNDYPYTREGVTVEDISLANCYCGIMISAGNELENNYHELNSPMDLSKSCGRHRIHNIMGGPLYRGIVLKSLLDTVDVTNCQFNYSCYISAYCEIRTTKCVDIFMSRGDGMSISNCLSYGAYHGLRTEPSFKNNMGTCSMRLSNCNFEGISPMALYSGGMYEITNCYFLGCHPCGYMPESTSVCLQIKQPEHCIHIPFIAINNCVFQNGSGANGISLDVRLTCGSNPMISDSQFWGWGEGEPVVQLNKSHKNAGSLTLSNCVFTGTGGIDVLPSNMPGTLARAEGPGYHEGDLRFVGCRFPEPLLNEISQKGIWYDQCVTFDDEGQNHRIQI